MDAERPAVIYARLSVDDGSRESTTRQVADCHAHAAKHELEVSEEYVDRDTSAYHAVRRPQWDAMLEGIQRGEVGAVIAWKLDRLNRRLSDFTAFWAAIESAGVRLLVVVDGIDSRTEHGWFACHQLALFAEMESRNTSTRTRRAKQASAMRGEMRHGGRRPFGHDAAGGIVETEAAAIRDAAARVLRGESVSSITRLWARQGVSTTTGQPWMAAKVRRLLLQPRLAGARVVGEDWIATGQIAPIIDEPTLRRVRAILMDSRRVTNHGRVHDRLLTGLLYCALCGARMETHAVKGRQTYQCYNRPERPACGKVAVTADFADDHVAGLVLDLIDVPEVRDALAAPADDHMAELAEQLANDQAQLERVGVMTFADRSMSEREYQAIRAALLTRINDAQRAIDRSASRSVPALVSGAIRDEWPTLPLDTRRLIARTVLARVECSPARKPTNVWRADRLSITLASALPDQPDNLGDLGST